MERRMANLMKENYEPFMKDLKDEDWVRVDTINSVIFLNFWHGKLIHHEITVDVANDAIWIDYCFWDTVLHYADRTSLPKPVLKSPL